MQKADADIYMIKNISFGLLLVAIFCRWNHRVFVYRSSSSALCNGSYFRNRRLMGKVFKFALKHAKAVIVQNEVDKEQLKRSFNIDSVSIANAYLACVPQEVERDIILWVGRSDAVKRPELFINLARNFPDETFIMICQQATGDRRYKRLVHKAEKVENLQFIKRVPFKEISGYFNRSKIFVNTSDTEGFPNTFIQACDCGTPILSLNVNPDGFLDKYKCGICTNDNWGKFVKSFKILLESDKGREYGRNGPEYIKQNYNINNTIGEYKKLFSSLVSGKGGNTI